jgi:ABC-type bacteriocin/lantibiotic exporter with double-glycine peptidase domain
MLKNIYLKIWRILPAIQRRNLVSLFFMIFIGMILEMLSVGIFMPSIISSENSIFKKYLPSYGNSDGQSNYVIILFLSAVLFLYFIKGLYQAFLSFKQVNFAFGVQNYLSEKIFSIYLNKPFSFFAEKNTSELINNSINEITILTFNGIIQGLLLITELFVTLGIVTLLLILEPRGTLIVLIIQVVSSVFFQRATQKKVANWGNKRQHYEQERIKHLTQGFAAIKEIKLRGAASEFIKIYRHSNSGVSEIGKKQQFVQQLPRIWLEFATIISIVLLVLLLLFNGHSLRSIFPILAVFAASAFRLLPSINRILSCIHYLVFASSTIDKIHSEINTAEYIESQKEIEFFDFETINLDLVCFKYPNTEINVINNFSYVIKRNDRIAIVGKSGSGKSTLMDLLLGLNFPTSGSISLDAYELSSVSRSYHKLIGYVPQSVYIFDDTLEKNIAFGVPEIDIDKNRIYDVIKLAQLDEVVNNLVGGISAKVGEEGGNLSGGQCQRIGIARALYHNPQILFFDEATSSLDESTENDILRTIFDISKDKTIFFITHKKENLTYFDKVIDLTNIPE